MIRIALSFILDGLAYWFRGGGIVGTGSDTLVRLTWAFVFQLGCYLQHPDYFLLWEQLSLFIGGFFSVTITHAFCQNSGTWGYLQCRWFTRWITLLPFFPAAWHRELEPDPNPTHDGILICPWGQVSMWQRRLFDFLQMMEVGAISGAIVWVTHALAMWGLYGQQPDVIAVATPIAVISFLQAVAYLLGQPVTEKFPKLKVTWPEVFNGFAWAGSSLFK